MNQKNMGLRDSNDHMPFESRTCKQPEPDKVICKFESEDGGFAEMEAEIDENGRARVNDDVQGEWQQEHIEQAYDHFNKRLDKAKKNRRSGAYANHTED